MQEKSLFTIIVVLLVAILGVGAYAAFQNPAAVAQIPSTAIEAVTTAVTDVTGTSGSFDRDRDGDTEADTDSDGDTSATTPTPVTTGTSSSGTQTTAESYTMAQVAAHNSASSCYTAINGSVYDLTPFINQHPGGPVILQLCGTDGTAAFEAQHGGQRRPESELASLKIGTLAK